MEKHWYGNPKVSGSGPCSVKFSLPIFQIYCIKVVQRVINPLPILPRQNKNKTIKRRVKTGKETSSQFIDGCDWCIIAGKNKMSTFCSHDFNMQACLVILHLVVSKVNGSKAQD